MRRCSAFFIPVDAIAAPFTIDRMTRFSAMNMFFDRASRGARGGTNALARVARPAFILPCGDTAWARLP